jgi:hypothetical protein
VHVLGNRLVAPLAQRTDSREDHVQATSTAGELHQVNRPVEHGRGVLHVALADMSQSEVREDDRLGLVPTVQAACGAIQDRSRLRPSYSRVAPSGHSTATGTPCWRA